MTAAAECGGVGCGIESGGGVRGCGVRQRERRRRGGVRNAAAGECGGFPHVVLDGTPPLASAHDR